MMIMANETGWQ